MNSGNPEAGLELSPERKELSARLRVLGKVIAKKVREFSRLMKEAEASDWDEERTRHADEVFDEGVQLNREYSALLSQMEASLSKEEKSSLEQMEEKSRFRVEEPDRFSKKDLAPHQIPVDQTHSLEASLENGLGHVLNHVPSGWLREQRARLAAAGDGHLRQPLILAGGMVDARPQPTIHPYAYALLLAEDSLAKKDVYDMYAGALLVPCLAALCDRLDGIHEVKGGVQKLEELPRAAPQETVPRIYELFGRG